MTDVAADRLGTAAQQSTAAGRSAQPPSADPQSWWPLLRRYGLRATTARVQVLQALQVMGHGTPEQIYDRIAPVLQGLNLSTVYRTLEVLAEHQLVTHAHLEQSSATYMLAAHADHAHLVCRGCHQVLEFDHDIATALTGQISHIHGFDVDTGHLSVFGRCDACTSEDLAGEDLAGEDLAGERPHHPA